MKMKRCLSLLCAFALVFSFVLVGSAADAFVPGDVSGDGEITAEDARLCLRQAVSLENYEKDSPAWLACDVVADGEITAEDARMILRAAVGLEDLHVHVFGDWTPEKDEADALTGSHVRVCEICGATETELCDFGEKTYLSGETEPTCTEDCVYSQTCAVCGAEKNTVEPALGHTFDPNVLSVDTDAVCERCGETLPCFNTLVNALKQSAHTYTGFSETVNKADVTAHKFKISLAAKLAAKAAGETLDENTLIEQFKEEMAGNEHTYGDYAFQRQITNNNYYLAGQEIVSALTQNDVQSVTVEQMEGVDFIAALPDSVQIQSLYSSATFTYDLAEKIKAAEIGEVLKVTVVLKEERYADIKDSAEPTALQKATDLDLREMVAELNQSQDQDGLKFEMKCTEAASKCTVTYYFDAVTYLPIAAVYHLTVDSAESVSMDMKLGGVSLMSGNMSFTMQNVSINYYFFDHYFD